MNLDQQTQPEARMPGKPAASGVSMRWYFILTAIVGLSITVLIRMGSVKIRILVGLLLLSILTFLFYVARYYVTAYFFGFLDQLLFSPTRKTQSPFAHETMPPQIIPPQTRD